MWYVYFVHYSRGDLSMPNCQKNICLVGKIFLIFLNNHSEILCNGKRIDSKKIIVKNPFNSQYLFNLLISYK